MVTESEAGFARGPYMKIRWADLIKPQKVETRTGEEIIGHMKNVIGKLEVTPDGPI